MSHRVDMVTRHMADCNIRNINTALEMFVADHGKRPFSLAELEPNYLRKVPPGDWGYVGLPLGVEGLDYVFAAPPGWTSHGRGRWEKGRQFLNFRLAGPYSPERVGEAWIQERATEQAEWSPGARLPAQFGELTGTELRGETLDFRYHRFLLTDGEIGWEFSYSARLNEWSDESDRMFVEMIRSRTSPTSDRSSPGQNHDGSLPG